MKRLKKIVASLVQYVKKLFSSFFAPLEVDMDFDLDDFGNQRKNMFTGNSVSTQTESINPEEVDFQGYMDSNFKDEDLSAGLPAIALFLPAYLPFLGEMDVSFEISETTGSMRFDKIIEIHAQTETTVKIKNIKLDREVIYPVRNHLESVAFLNVVMDEIRKMKEKSNLSKEVKLDPDNPFSLN